jgi:hypothetical protein
MMEPVLDMIKPSGMLLAMLQDGIFVILSKNINKKTNIPSCSMANNNQDGLIISRTGSIIDLPSRLDYPSKKSPLSMTTRDNSELVDPPTEEPIAEGIDATMFVVT